MNAEVVTESVLARDEAAEKGRSGQASDSIVVITPLIHDGHPSRETLDP